MSDSESDLPESLSDCETESDLDTGDLNDDLPELEEDDSMDDLWRPVLDQDVGPRPIPFTAAPGPKHAPAPNAKPIDYFDLFITDEFLNLIIAETNRYADQFIDRNKVKLEVMPRSQVHKWRQQGPLSITELRAFLGIILNMGLNDKPNVNAYWDSTNLSQETPWFPKHFNRDRFQIILKFLHFNDNDKLPDTDHEDFKLFKIEPLIKHFNQKFTFLYHPDRNISIDESMVGFKGKTPHIRQYMPNKRHSRFGIKLWCLSDSSNGYLCQMEVYTGVQKTPRQKSARNFTHELVVRLLTQANFLNRGHHLGLDNFFTSVDLLKELYLENTTATGTVRVNRKGLPEFCVKKKLKNKETSAARNGNLLCLAYQDSSRKPILLSTSAKAGIVDTVNSRNQAIRRPEVIQAYNQAMGGVDLGDEKLYMYLSERRTLKWTNKVFFSLLGRAVLNSFIIYKINTTDSPKLSRYSYMVNVVESLAQSFYPPKVIRRKRSRAVMESTSEQAQPSQFSKAHPLDGHDLVKLPVGKKRQCVAGHPNRVRTGWECSGCKLGMCPECFAKFHRGL